MKVKDLISELSSFDPEAEIVIAYDFNFDFQVPYFVRTKEHQYSTSGQFLPKGSYVHITE